MGEAKAPSCSTLMIALRMRLGRAYAHRNDSGEAWLEYQELLWDYADVTDVAPEFHELYLELVGEAFTS